MENIISILIMISFILIDSVVVMGLMALFRFLKQQSIKQLPAPVEDPKLPEPPLTTIDHVHYSKELMNLLDDIVINKVTMKFKEFQDTYDHNKINKGIAKDVIEEFALDIYESIDKDKLVDYIKEYTLFDEKFFIEYIILSVANNTKILLEHQ